MWMTRSFSACSFATCARLYRWQLRAQVARWCPCFVSPTSSRVSSLGRHARRFLVRHRFVELSKCVPRRALASIASSTNNNAQTVYYYSDCYEHPLPTGHRFPMDKYRLVRTQLERHPRLSCAKFVRAPLATVEDLVLVHDEQYIHRYVTGKMTENEIRASGFPWSRAGVTRALASTGGTIAAAKTLLSNRGLRICGQVAGGTHHASARRASARRASGFCIFNDIAVAARVALRDFKDTVSHILVIDLDTHQGKAFHSESQPWLLSLISQNCSNTFISSYWARQRACARTDSGLGAAVEMGITASQE